MRRAFLALLLVAGCDEERAAAPDPVAMTAEATSHFCLMNLSEHAGPKAQIHLEGAPEPLFFAQVRDALAYLRGPERSAPITAVYVSDMGRAPSWESPGRDNWIAADAAHFVVGSSVQGGMRAPEVVPFGTAEAAADFAAREGGKVLALGEIPDDAVLGAIELRLPGESE